MNRIRVLHAWLRAHSAYFFAAMALFPQIWLDSPDLQALLPATWVSRNRAGGGGVGVPAQDAHRPADASEARRHRQGGRVMDDIDTLARTLWGEARNQGMDGMAAVANVITTRVDIDLHDDKRPDWWGEGFREVCQKPWQFSCWNGNDPNRLRLLAVTASDPQFSDALVIAAAAIGGKLRDRTNGATHYFAPKVVKPPAWTAGLRPTATIGDHVFYRSTT